MKERLYRLQELMVAVPVEERQQDGSLHPEMTPELVANRLMQISVWLRDNPKTADITVVLSGSTLSHVAERLANTVRISQ